ncbi:hypothetical protein BCR44DRAFT_1276925 [Catenaria anguillulae PL171]|uniref:Uncharacterized protein n=1 Tax=Catenaria anguillulae PL171 TaxID=765915 RepID=A0A1Y2HBW0_9FUNG|nr:hypothetical protein BCR44DRAFT_1276925 [Catenaria anguillulae PL171]
MLTKLRALIPAAEFSQLLNAKSGADKTPLYLACPNQASHVASSRPFSTLAPTPPSSARTVDGQPSPPVRAVHVARHGQVRAVVPRHCSTAHAARILSSRSTRFKHTPLAVATLAGNHEVVNTFGVSRIQPGQVAGRVPCRVYWPRPGSSPGFRLLDAHPARRQCGQCRAAACAPGGTAPGIVVARGKCRWRHARGQGRAGVPVRRAHGPGVGGPGGCARCQRGGWRHYVEEEVAVKDLADVQASGDVTDEEEEDQAQAAIRTTTRTPRKRSRCSSRVPRPCRCSPMCTSWACWIASTWASACWCLKLKW